ncbi:formate dehydrogenase accessory sulfurtransferase FdhD [Salinisphaera sp.]|uniref:formate dehydrogenase accessory sulfurtransferase FdhD n=1 Tax=Salinisphaera sp. TaxID=1914330 RepID=UPI002D7A05CF|nr:formate dehydrogenase accessory sulfurtransferase FdhD [Salinisphaera sp.]HET7312770.1 formate dehydrogenase accessory sulfurtransferase FdhD [Salinisphaera sp.]
MRRSDDPDRPDYRPDYRPKPVDAPAAARERVAIADYRDGIWRAADDTLAVERALEIHVAGAEPLITMRTPGHDRELAAGLLHGEGVVRSAADIVYLRHSADEPDVIRAMLKPEARARLDRIERNTLATSACGVCGKPSFRAPRPARAVSRGVDGLRVDPDWLLGLPERMRVAQDVFESTGGLHAAAIFRAGGDLVALREDVGRHNALDKLIGRALLDARLPLSEHVLMLSGRASFELMQKAGAAGIPVVCAISAPSSFAVEIARRFSTTLVGFLRGERFNCYSGAQRLGRA